METNKGMGVVKLVSMATNKGAESSREHEENNDAFKSCRIDRIYELDIHERHNKVVVMSGNLKIVFKKPRVSELGACQWENVLECKWMQPKTIYIYIYIYI